MTQYGTWVSFGGAARIWLAAGLLAVAAVPAGAAFRLARPVPIARLGGRAAPVLVVTWIASIVAFLVCISIYINGYVSAFRLQAGHGAPVNRITPVTLATALVVFIVLLACTRGPAATKMGAAAVGAMIGPMIFELPFDLIVMSRTYPGIPPDPAGYRVLFFAPLFLIEITTLLLLRLVPAARLTRAALVCFALMLAVFAVWALTGFGYPSTAGPITLNIVSKLLAFATGLMLFPLRRRGSTQPSQQEALSQTT